MYMESLPNSETPCFGIYTPFYHGISLMVGISGEYTPPEPPETPDGGTPVQSNVVPFKKKVVTPQKQTFVRQPLKKVA